MFRMGKVWNIHFDKVSSTNLCVVMYSVFYQVDVKIVNKHWPHIALTLLEDMTSTWAHWGWSLALVSADNSILIPSIIMGWGLSQISIDSRRLVMILGGMLVVFWSDWHDMTWHDMTKQGRKQSHAKLANSRERTQRMSRCSEPETGLKHNILTSIYVI